MMKSLVVYSSKSGNTEKLARALFDALDGEKELHPIDRAPDPNGYDLVAIGFWLQAGKPDPRAAAYLREVGAVPLFLFASHGAASDSAHARGALSAAAALAPAARVVGRFNCQGEVDAAFLEKARAKNPPPPWLGDAPAAAGHPDAADLARLAAALRQALPDAVR